MQYLQTIIYNNKHIIKCLQFFCDQGNTVIH